MEPQQLIDELYVTFADVPKPPKVLGCPCQFCISTEKIDLLLSQPLRTTDKKLMRVLAETIMSTVGDENAFHYFLPRMLHLSLIDPNFIEMPAVFLLNLSEARVENWTESHQQVIQKFLRLKVESVCTANDEWQLEDWICGICHLPFDITEFLGILDRPDNQKVKVSLLCLFTYNGLTNRINGNWWKDVSTEKQKPLFEWATNDENILILIEQGYWVE